MQGIDLSPLINLGGIGLVLAWFLLRCEPRLHGIEDAVNRMSKAILLLVVANEHTTDAAQREAQGLIREIEALGRKP